MQTLKPLVFTTAAQNKTVEMDSGLLQKYRNECWDLAKKTQKLSLSRTGGLQCLFIPSVRWKMDGL